MSNRDNYYILLELDLSIRDDASIAAAIKAKKAEWSKLGNHPTKGTWARQQTQKLKDVEAVLGDPQQRNEEADEAQKIKLAEVQKKHGQLRKAAHIVVENGEISREALDVLIKEFAIGESELLGIINAKVKEGAKFNYKDDGIVPLDSNDIKTIRKDLDVVKKKNLFDFLGLVKGSSCKDLLDRANELYSSASKNANKTAEITATVTLSGLCKKWLKDDGLKSRYEKTLRLEAFEDVKSIIDIAAIDGIIDAQEYQKIIETCTKNGIDIDEAEFRIYEYCNEYSKKKKPVPKIIRSENAEYKKMAQCGICGHLNDKSAINCGNCGNSMKIVCPKCGKEAESASKNCSDCGFSIGGMPNANPLMRDAEIELKKKNFIEARNLLAQAEAYNPKHRNIERIKEELAKEDEVVRKIREYISAKKFSGVRKGIEKLKTIHPNNSDIPKFEKTAKDGIDAADKLCKTASVEQNTNKKLDLFIEALDKCADYPPALTGISSCPVDAPSGLTAVADKKTVVLNWRSPVENRTIKYKIVRKKNSAPANQGDGVVVGEAEATNFRDTTAEFYKDYYYCVFSVRGDSMSEIITTQTSVVLEMGLEDVKNLKGNLSGDSIYLDWVFPKDCEKVKIEYSHDEKKTTPVTKTCTRSEYETKKGWNIKNPPQVDFYFTVYACYESDGREYFSKGVDCFVANSEKTYVSYSVKKSPFSKSANLRLKCKSAPVKLPEIIVVAKQGGFPVTKTDGKCIKTISSMKMGNSVLNIDISAQSIEGCQVRLFSTAGNQKIELLRKE